MKKNFSPAFCSFIGDDNVHAGEIFRNDQYVDVNKASIEMLLSESCKILEIKRIDRLGFIRSILESEFGCISMHDWYEAYRTFPVDGDPRVYMFKWKKNKETKSVLEDAINENGNGFISLCAMLFNESWLTSQNRLEKINGLEARSVFNFSTDQDGLWVEVGKSRSYNFYPPNIEIGGENLKLIEKYALEDSYLTKGAFVLYRSDMGSELLLPCRLGVLSLDNPVPCTIDGNAVLPQFFERKKNLNPGDVTYFALGQIGKAYLLNMDRLNQLPSCKKVLLFESPLLAIKIQNLIKQFDQNIRNEYLVTSWFGRYESINCADFSYLKGKKVVFIPEISFESYEKASKCRDKCIKNLVSEFMILICPIALKDMPKNADLNNMTFFERLLAREAVTISDLDQNSFVDLIAKAMSFDEYSKKRGCKGGGSPEAIEHSCPAECLTSIDNIACVGDESTDLSYDRIVQTKKITIIIGPNDSGKSIFLLSILRAIADGASTFGIEARKRRRVLLIDGETDKDMLAERNERIKSALKSSQEQYAQGDLYSIGIGFGNSFDFAENCSCTQVEKYLCDNKIEVVAFDNLNSLVPGHVQSPQKISTFFVWLRKLEETYGVAIVLAHHTKDEKGENKRSSGSKEIDEKCQTVIAITGRNELEALKDNEVPPELVKYKYSKGALFQVHVKKCKNVHKLEGEVFYCHLPLNVEFPTTGPGWTCFQDGSRMASSSLKFEQNKMSVEIYLQRYSILPDKERRVMMKLGHNGTPFSRKEVDRLLGCSAETSRKILRNLMDVHGLIVALEDGKNTKNSKYSLHPDQVAGGTSISSNSTAI